MTSLVSEPELPAPLPMSRDSGNPCIALANPPRYVISVLVLITVAFIFPSLSPLAYASTTLDHLVCFSPGFADAIIVSPLNFTDIFPLFTPSLKSSTILRVLSASPGFSPLASDCCFCNDLFSLLSFRDPLTPSACCFCPFPASKRSFRRLLSSPWLPFLSP